MIVTYDGEGGGGGRGQSNWTTVTTKTRASEPVSNTSLILQLIADLFFSQRKGSLFLDRGEREVKADSYPVSILAV